MTSLRERITTRIPRPTTPTEPLLTDNPPRTQRPWLARPSKAHQSVIAAVLISYALVVIGVVTTSPLVSTDWTIMLFRPWERWPHWQSWLNTYELLGQRGPTAGVALAWLAHRSRRTRSLRPLLVGTTALGLLNLSVGTVKILLGRLGPHLAHVAGSNELFQGGDIFPSGHTSNAVVTWGVLAYLATRRRLAAAALAALVAATVGLGTLYLGTHWLSDVLAGWAAGALVLLVLPCLEPFVADAEQHIQARLPRLRTNRDDLTAAPPPSRPLVPPPRS